MKDNVKTTSSFKCLVLPSNLEIWGIILVSVSKIFHATGQLFFKNVTF